jgi:hypothetical protein
MEISRKLRAFREQVLGPNCRKVHSDRDNDDEDDYDDDILFYVKITLHITPISTFHLLALLILTSTLQMSVASVALSPVKYVVAMASQTYTAFVKSNFTFYMQHVRVTAQATKLIWQ